MDSRVWGQRSHQGQYRVSGVRGYIRDSTGCVGSEVTSWMVGCVCLQAGERGAWRCSGFSLTKPGHYHSVGTSTSYCSGVGLRRFEDPSDGPARLITHARVCEERPWSRTMMRMIPANEAAITLSTEPQSSLERERERVRERD